MNRNNRKSKQKSLQKTAHTQSWTQIKSPHQNNIFNDRKQTHFLKVDPQKTKLTKTSKPAISKFTHHFASTTQLISTPFQAKAYVPPHLNSSQIFTCMNSECQNWKVRPSSATKKLNYDSLYNTLESKYQKAIPCGSRLKKWTAGSKIKNMVEQDRTRFEFKKPYKLYVQEQSGSQAEVEYMNDSQQQQSQEQSNSYANGNSSHVISINNNSRLKDKSNFMQTQA